MQKDPHVWAHLHLQGVLPVFPHLVAVDAESQRLCADLQGTLALQIMGGEGGHVTFDGAKVTAGDGPGESPKVRLLFPTAAQVNVMFQGGTPLVLPVGFWHMGLLKGFAALGKRMEHFTKDPAAFENDPEGMPIVVRLLLFAALHGTRALGHHDPHAKALVGKIDGSAELCIRNAGSVANENGDLVATVFAEEGRLEVHGHSTPNPTVRLELPDLHTAFLLLTNKLDAVAAVCDTSVKIQGLLPLFDNLSAVMDRVGRYMT